MEHPSPIREAVIGFGLAGITLCLAALAAIAEGQWYPLVLGSLLSGLFAWSTWRELQQADAPNLAARREVLPPSSREN